MQEQVSGYEALIAAKATHEESWLYNCHCPFKHTHIDRMLPEVYKEKICLLLSS